MKRRIKIFSNIVLFSIIISILNFPTYTSLAVRESYYNTRGQEFIRNLNDTKTKDNIIKNLPYNLIFSYKNKQLSLKNKALYKNNRIYVELKDVIQKLDFKEIINNNKIIINNKIILDVMEKNFEKNNDKIPLRGDLFIENGEYYISLFDLCEILNLTTFWNYDNNTIYIDNKKDNDNEIKNENENDKKAYIRFEDFTAGDVYLSKGALEKVRLVADYMNKNNEAFSISWIPRYINKDLNIDNDISKNESMKNANFLFTLDYIVNRGGSIGLHGYTHQFKDSNSVTGFEFGDSGYNNPEDIRKRVESALTVASNLNVPITYWETPHYKTTAKQQKIFEEYFKIIYEPAIGIYNSKIITSENNEYTKYIPTPLGYVDDDTGERILKSIKDNYDNKELSFFYHLSIEIKSIDIWVSENGSILNKYTEDSILKKIVNTTNELGYKFFDIKKI